MYLGELMEEAPAQTLWKEGIHPYTELLFSSVSKAVAMKSPEAGGTVKENSVKPIYAVNQEGCAFANRCPYADEQCFSKKPEFREIKAGHKLRCFKK
jgi:oligopeptide/dipeptide ABC transporter ATP-binding protein